MYTIRILYETYVDIYLEIDIVVVKSLAPVLRNEASIFWV